MSYWFCHQTDSLHTLISCIDSINRQRSIGLNTNPRVAHINFVSVEHPLEVGRGIALSFALEHRSRSENDFQIVWILHYLGLLCEERLGKDRKLLIFNSLGMEHEANWNWKRLKPTQLQWKSCSMLMSFRSRPSIISGDLQFAEALRRLLAAWKCFTSHITEQSHSNKLLSNRSVLIESMLSKMPNGIRWILFPYRFLESSSRDER